MPHRVKREAHESPDGTLPVNDGGVCKGGLSEFLETRSIEMLARDLQKRSQRLRRHGWARRKQPVYSLRNCTAASTVL
jgi:hypothetical protein